MAVKRHCFLCAVIILAAAIACQAEFQVNTYTNDDQEHPAIEETIKWPKELRLAEERLRKLIGRFKGLRLPLRGYFFQLRCPLWIHFLFRILYFNHSNLLLIST